MSLCNKNMTPLQRRSVQRIGVVSLLTVFTNITSTSSPLVHLIPSLSLSHLTSHQAHLTPLFVATLAIFSLLPVLLAVWTAANYLKAEPDEFVRALVIRALLWGLAVTMAGDAIAGVFMTLDARPFPIAVLNSDLLLASTGIAFRLLQRSYR